MAKLTELITQQLVLLEELKVLLEGELHLISTRDAESLTKLIKQKEQNLTNIATQDQLIEQAYGVEYNEQTAAEFDPLFTQARELLEQCKYRTEINAKAVEQGQLRLEHLRNLLLEARAKESMTYDKSGKPKGGTKGTGVKA